MPRVELASTPSISTPCCSASPSGDPSRRRHRSLPPRARRFPARPAATPSPGCPPARAARPRSGGRCTRSSLSAAARARARSAAPPRAARYTLIVASTEHEFSSGCCRVFDPDLPDAEKRRSAAAASSGRFLCRSKAMRRAPRRSATGWLWLNAGVAEYASTLHTCDPAVISGISSLMAVA